MSFALNMHAQYSTPDSLLKIVLEHNKTLKAARESYRVSILEAGTGNTPPDPEVEFGYLYGNPMEMGNRVDFRVSQEVDFPTAYLQKSRIRKTKTSQATLEYTLSRQEILLQAQQLWIEAVYLNLNEKLLSHRVDQAEAIHNHFSNMLMAGELDRLTYSQSSLQHAAIESEYEQLKSNIRNNLLAISEMAGGEKISVTDTIFPPHTTIIPDSLFHAYIQSPGLQSHYQKLRLKEEQKSLVMSQSLPKLSAGYYSESVLDQQFKGFQVGITVPLWENVNQMKKAKTEVLYAEADAERYLLFQQKEIEQKLEQLESVKSVIRKLEEALEEGDQVVLLTHLLESGEISLSEYFYASDFYFRNRQLLLRYKRDQYLMEAELLKVHL